MALRISPGSVPSIFLPRAAPLAVRFAAEQLSYYIALLTDTRPPIVEGEPTRRLPGPTLILRVERVTHGAADAGHADSARFSVAGDRAELVASNAFGLLHGVYCLLEKFCGVYWLNRWEADELVPRLPWLVLPDGRYMWRARFSCRAFTNYPDLDQRTPDFVDWMAKRGFNHYVINPTNPQIWEGYRSFLRETLMLRGMNVSLGHHTLPFWLPPEEHFQNHPEYYALIGGRRQPDAQICTSSTEATRLIAERVVSFLRENPEIKEVGIWPRDGFGWCECDACLNLQEQRPSWWSSSIPCRTDTYMRFVNAVAELVGEQMPQARLSALAYLNYVEPPANVRPLPNVVVYFAPFAGCLRHSLDHPECVRRNADYLRFLRQWRELTAGELRLFLYLMQIDTLSLPLRITDVLPAYLDLLAREGIDGWVMEYVPEEWATFAPNAYLISHLAWSWGAERTSVEHPGEDILRSYYEALYGPAAEEMAACFKAIIEDFVADGPCTGHYDLTYAQRATPGLLRRALRHLGRARTLAAEDRPAWRAVTRAHIATELLLRVGEWQRALASVRNANDETRARRCKMCRAAAAAVIEWAEAHADTGALHADKIRRRVAQFRCR
jgi:hypothetical protein